MLGSDVSAHQGRRVPVQTRSRRTVARIKRATLELLAEEGPDSLNTNAIAERAEVNISTLYGYYPDKYAIVDDLFEEIELRRTEYVVGMLDQLRESGDWQAWFREIVGWLAQYRLSDPGVVVLRRSMSLRPRLYEMDVISSGKMAEQLGGVLAERCALDSDRGRLIASVVVEVITALLDSAFSVTPPDSSKVAEASDVVIRYLEPVFASVDGLVLDPLCQAACESR